MCYVFVHFNLNSLPCKLPSFGFNTKGTPIQHMRLSHGIISTECVTNISQMKELKILELNEISGLNDGHITELAKGLGHQLEKLRFEGSTAVNLTVTGLKHMLRYAVKLTVLYLESCNITIDVESYEVMLNILQNRPEKIKFSLVLRGRRGNVKVSEEVLMENDDVFHIDHD